MQDNNLINLQLLNLCFLLMRQVSDSFDTDAERQTERNLIMSRLQQLQNNPKLQECHCSGKMLSHLKRQWQSLYNAEVATTSSAAALH